MINKDLVKKLAQKLDALLDFAAWIPNKIVAAIAEAGDGYLLGYGLGYLNDKFGDAIPVNNIDDVEKAIACFCNDDFLGMLSAIPEGLNDVIDIKFFEDDFQAQWLAINFNAAFKAATYYAHVQVKQLN